MGCQEEVLDVLKPYGKQEGRDFLSDKRVAVDLSFFRTLNLFSKFGAFPVFVVDGSPSPLKSKARILRFFQASGIDRSSLSLPEERVLLERNRVFNKCVRDCVELLKLLEMPVLEAKGEAEGLCSQLNKDGHVDACITADSDAFLFGAKYIDVGLGPKRNHLITISLLVGNDHDLGGVQGIGIETAIRFTSCYRDEEILNRQYEFNSIKRVKGDLLYDVDEINGMEDSFNNESDMPQIYVDDECCFLLTDERMNLVESAFLEEVHKFFAEKELKDSRKRKSGSSTPNGNLEVESCTVEYSRVLPCDQSQLSRNIRREHPE